MVEQPDTQVLDDEKVEVRDLPKRRLYRLPNTDHLDNWAPNKSEIDVSEQCDKLDELEPPKDKRDQLAPSDAEIMELMQELLKPAFEKLNTPEEDRLAQAEACANILLSKSLKVDAGQLAVGQHTAQEQARRAKIVSEDEIPKWADRADVKWEPGELEDVKPTPVEFLRKFYKARIDSGELEHAGQFRSQKIDIGLFKALDKWLSIEGNHMPDDLDLPFDKDEVISRRAQKASTTDYAGMSMQEYQNQRYAVKKSSTPVR